MPWLGESRNPDQLEIKKIEGRKIQLAPIKDDAIRFWAVFHLVDGEQWQMLKKLHRSRLEWEIPSGLKGSFMVRSVDGANRMSSPANFEL